MSSRSSSRDDMLIPVHYAHQGVTFPMTDDLSASRERVKQLRDAVNAIDDFISRHCQSASESLENTLDGIFQVSSILHRTLEGEWSDDDDQLTEIHKVVRGVGGRVLEVDTRNARPATKVMQQIEEVITPAMQYGQLPYMWQVPIDADSSWRVIFTLPISEEHFEKVAVQRHKDLEEELAVAEVMLS